jgi:hypothetical protein
MYRGRLHLLTENLQWGLRRLDACRDAGERIYLLVSLRQLIAKIDRVLSNDQGSIVL